MATGPTCTKMATGPTWEEGVLNKILFGNKHSPVNHPDELIGVETGVQHFHVRTPSRLPVCWPGWGTPEAEQGRVQCFSPGQGRLGEIRNTKYSDVWIIWIRHVWRTWSCVGLPCSGLLANQEVKKKLFSWRIWKDTFTQSFHWYWCYNSIVRETVSNVT